MPSPYHHPVPLVLPDPGWGMSLVHRLVPPLQPGHPLAILDLAPANVSYPIYFPHWASLLPAVGDRYLSVIMPIASYWFMALGYLFLDWARIPLFERYRIRDPQEASVRNRVSLPVVAKAVILQQCVQAIAGIACVEPDSVGQEQVFRDHAAYIRAVGQVLTSIVARVLGVRLGSLFLRYFGTVLAEFIYWWLVPVLHLLYAFFILDTYQYWCHRLFHQNRFLYRRVHSYHHKLIVTHAVGAIYNHWFEGLVMDTLSGVITYLLCRLTVRQGMFVFTLSTAKTVNDHGGFDFPFWISPINCLWPNTIDYHDAHHQPQGFRFNFSQPYFIHWDEITGTRMRPEQLARMNAFDSQGRWKERLPTAKGEKKFMTAKRLALQPKPKPTPKPSANATTNANVKQPATAKLDSAPIEKHKQDLPPLPTFTSTSGIRDLTLTPESVRARKHRSMPASMLRGESWGTVLTSEMGTVYTAVLPYHKS